MTESTEVGKFTPEQIRVMLAAVAFVRDIVSEAFEASDDGAIDTYHIRDVAAGYGLVVDRPATADEIQEYGVEPGETVETTELAPLLLEIANEIDAAVHAALTGAGAEEVQQ